MCFPDSFRSIYQSKFKETMFENQFEMFQSPLKGGVGDLWAGFLERFRRYEKHIRKLCSKNSKSELADSDDNCYDFTNKLDKVWTNGRPW